MAAVFEEPGGVRCGAVSARVAHELACAADPRAGIKISCRQPWRLRPWAYAIDAKSANLCSLVQCTLLLPWLLVLSTWIAVVYVRWKLLSAKGTFRLVDNVLGEEINLNGCNLTDFPGWLKNSFSVTAVTVIKC